MKKTKKVGGENRPAKCFAYVPDPEKPDTWKLPIYNTDGSVDKDRLPKAYAAMTSNYQGEKADVPQSARAAVMAKIRAAYKKAGMEWPGKKSEGDESPMADFFIEGEILNLVEAEGEKDNTRIWESILIRPGLSKNQTYYPEAVLRKAAALFEGAPALDRDDGAHMWDMARSVKNIVGIFTEVKFREGALRGKLNILKDGAWLHEKMVETRALGKKDSFGLSIVASGTASIKRHRGAEVRMVESIDRVSSVDPVINPAAGGRFIKLAAAEDASLQGEIEMFKALLKLIEAKRPDLLKDKDLENISEAEILTLAGEAMLTEAEITAAVKPPEPPKKEPETKTELQISEAEKAATARIAEAEKRFNCRLLLTEKLAESKLPAQTLARIKTLYDGKIFTEAEIDKAIKDERDYLALFAGGGQISGAGGPTEILLDARDKKVKALDGFFLGENQKIKDQTIPAFRSIKEAYIELTGDKYLTGRISEASRLREMVDFPLMGKFSESMISTTLAQLLGDSITRKMISDYKLPGLDEWKLLVSDNNPIMDFRSNKRGRMGGYGDLPDVAERGDYLPLTSPGDEETYYSISKRGGTEDITLEMIANDDIGAVRRIPTALSNAAKSTLFNFVMGLMTGNPTCLYDSVALFDSGHGNYSASGLSLGTTAMNTIRVAMRSQAAYGNATQILGLVPKYLWVPNELEDLANKICNALVNLISHATTEVSDMPNLHHGIKPVVIDSWTDADDYYVTADPKMVPMLEIGFFMGREEPELFLQNLPTLGSMFLADKLTWKIRHIYGGVPLDHRGFYYSKV